MWIPVTIKDNNSISWLEIQAQPSSSGTQQKNENIWIFSVKLDEQITPVISFGGAVKAQVTIPYHGIDQREYK